MAGVDAVVVGAAVVLTGGAVEVAGDDAGVELALEPGLPAELEGLWLTGVLFGSLTVRLERRRPVELGGVHGRRTVDLRSPVRGGQRTPLVQRIGFGPECRRRGPLSGLALQVAACRHHDDRRPQPVVRRPRQDEAPGLVGADSRRQRPCRRSARRRGSRRRDDIGRRTGRRPQLASVLGQRSVPRSLGVWQRGAGGRRRHPRHRVGLLRAFKRHSHSGHDERLG